MSRFVTEEQFNKLQDLLKLCDSRGLSRDIQYRISLEAYMSCDYERFLSEIAEMVNAGAIPSVEGIPCKISLRSDGQGYGPMPKEDDPIVQRVTLRDDGRAWITYSNWNGKQLNQNRLSVDAVKAAALIRKISLHFSIDPDGIMVTDVGSWDLKVINTDKQAFKFSGPLFADRWYSSLSDELRLLLGKPELYAFDGQGCPVEAIRICNCVFEYGDKEYCYRTDDPDIREGQTVIVPVGNEGRTAFARVVAIEYLNEDELPLPLDQIKFIKGIFGDLRSFETSSGTTLYDIVKAAIDANDCMSLLEMDAPADEYDGESKDITNCIRPEMDKYQIASIIAEVMSHSFNEPFSSLQFIETATWIRERMDEMTRLQK